MADEIDWSDPCARSAALEQAYYAILTGKAAVRIRFRGGPVEKEVWRHATADLQRLEREMKQAKAECQAKTSGRPPRFAITAG